MIVQFIKNNKLFHEGNKNTMVFSNNTFILNPLIKGYSYIDRLIYNNNFSQLHIICQYIHDKIHHDLSSDCYVRALPLKVDRYKILIDQLKDTIESEGAWGISCFLVALQYGTGKYKNSHFVGFSKYHWDEIIKYRMTIMHYGSSCEVLMFTNERYKAILKLNDVIQPLIQNGCKPFKNL